MAQANMEIENMQQDNMKQGHMDQENNEEEKDPTLKFIEAVKEHKCIWDMQSEEYYNRRIYRAAWRALLPPSEGFPLQKPLNSEKKAEIKRKVAELQKVWVELRDSYYKNEDPGKKYKDSLRFLHSVYQSREMEAVLEFDEPSWDLMDLRTWTVKKSHIPRRERITDPAPEYELKRVRKRKFNINGPLNTKKVKGTDKENATDHENATEKNLTTDKVSENATGNENVTDKSFVTDEINMTDMENATGKANKTNKEKTTDKENATDEKNPSDNENIRDEITAPNNKNIIGKETDKKNAPDEVSVHEVNVPDNKNITDKENAPDEVNALDEVYAPDEVNTLNNKNIADKDNVLDKKDIPNMENATDKDNASTSKEIKTQKQKTVVVRKNKPNENQLSILEKAMRLYELENPGIWSSDEEDPDKASRVYVDNTSQTDETYEFPNMPINVEWWLDMDTN